MLFCPREFFAKVDVGNKEFYLRAFGLLPPAPFLGSGTLMTGDRWLVTAGL